MQHNFSFLQPTEIQLGFDGPEWDDFNATNFLTENNPALKRDLLDANRETENGDNLSGFRY